LVAGTETFREQYIKNKVDDWVKDLQMLSNYAQDDPQAAYSAFTRRIMLQMEPMSKEQYRT